MHFFLQLTDDKGFPIKNFSVTEPKKEEVKKPVQPAQPEPTVETITDVIQRQPTVTPTTKATTIAEEFEESDPFEEPTLKKSKSDIMYIFNSLVDDYVDSKDDATACD